jgi:hypothetical protein
VTRDQTNPAPPAADPVQPAPRTDMGETNQTTGANPLAPAQRGQMGAAANYPYQTIGGPNPGTEEALPKEVTQAESAAMSRKYGNSW